METIDVLEKPYSPTKDWGDKEWNKFTNWLTGMLKINESVIDRTLIDYLIQDSIPYFFSDVKSTKVLVRWDV